MRTPAPIVNDWDTSPNKEVLCCAFYWWRQPRLLSAGTPTGDVASFIWPCVATVASLKVAMARKLGRQPLLDVARKGLDYPQTLQFGSHAGEPGFVHGVK